MSNPDKNSKQQPGPDPEQLRIDMPWEDAVKQALEAPSPDAPANESAETEADNNDDKEDDADE